MKTKKKVVLRTLDKNYIIIKCFSRNEYRKSFLNKYVNFVKKNKYISYKPKNYLEQIIYLKNINKSNFDIILDDGLHTFEAGITLFLNSFDKLRKNGIYIIEDVDFMYIKKLADTLSKYNPEIIILNDNNTKHLNNNLILIRKY